ncbi:RNA-binding domain-containing protein [Anaeromyces robustus]|uniref:RNA-binding domain-containing protein n=1 Tax=Anaeromyces robustus TaxID=1754192 RepID=A0A1Y1X5G0_9FUNG|nr:RNA-binding domain-containing protein [Anaeromyces robustus]|eukprot:ORX81013.1 RNA-binding domain-containing protein [Anaeromyces robustus]
MWYLEEYNPLLAGSIDGTDTLPHDHGIVRAINSYYSLKKPVISSLTSDSLKTLFIGRLNENTKEEDIKNVFSKFGKIKNVRIILDIVTGISRGYGFIEFESEKECKEAYKNGDNIKIDGQKILVDYERSRIMKNWIPRRLGGGFGGKKESGQLRFGSIDRPFKEPINIGENQKMPDISRNQKYSDCWRDYLFKKAKESKSKNDKNNENISKKDNRSSSRHTIEDKYNHSKNHNSRHSSKEKYKDNNRSRSRERRLSKDKYKDRNRSRSRERRSSKDKYKDRNRSKSHDRHISKDKYKDLNQNRSNDRHYNKRHRDDKYDKYNNTKRKHTENETINNNKRSRNRSRSKSNSRHHHHSHSHDKYH